MARRRGFSVFGDSISTFEGFVPRENAVYYQGDLLARTGVERVEQTWWMRVIERLGGRLVANGSFSGSMVEGAGFPAACSPERIAQVRGEGGEAPDVVMVFIGINDYGWGGARAQAEGRSAAAPGCLDYGSILESVAGMAPADEALCGFSQAYDRMISSLQETLPGAEIWVMTLVPGRERGAERSTFCYRLRGVSFDAYNDAIRTVARKRGCRLLDVRAFSLDYESADGTHPTARGMAQLAEMLLASLDASGAEALRASGLFSPCLQSEQWCDEAACVGCDHARNTGNQWSCVCEKALRD